jgi:arabinose-5-phosphate isomerase
MTGVTGADGRLVGVYTDGDLRRTLNQQVDVLTCVISTVMTRDPVTVTRESLAAEAVRIMHANSINGLFVLDDERRVQGALNMHDLLRAGVV